jgi:hypothetical protein
MTHKLFIGQSPEGYSLKISSEEEKEGIRYNTILRRGNFSDLIMSLKDVPEEVYKEGVKLDFGQESVPFPISNEGKNVIRGLVAVLEKEAFHQFLDRLEI